MGLLKKDLLPFQKIGAANLTDNYHHLLGDDMGLGKTVQFLAACAFHKFKRVGVVVPAAVRPGWRQEIEECGLNQDNFFIESYEGAVNNKFPAGNYDCFGIDEAHYLKNADSMRCQAIFNNETGLAHNSPFVWPMTGTAILARPRELYPLLRNLAQERLGPNYDTFDKFAQKFCYAHWDGRGINTKGASSLDELSQILNGFMTRRLVEDVLPDMPPVLLSRPPLELSPIEFSRIEEIEREIEGREAYLSMVKQDYANLGDTARLRKATGVAKAKAIADFVDDLILSGAGKIAVFFHHRDVLKILEQELGHRFPVVFAGGMTDKQKDKAKLTFAKDKDCEVFLGQIDASGTGINGIQGVSHTIVFAELDWLFEKMRQNMARLRRMGMDMGRPVNAYMPHVKGTIESAMLQVNVGNKMVVERVYGRENKGVIIQENSPPIIRRPQSLITPPTAEELAMLGDLV